MNGRIVHLWMSPADKYPNPFKSWNDFCVALVAIEEENMFVPITSTGLELKEKAFLPVKSARKA
jgi:hypothetical protein